MTTFTMAHTMRPTLDELIEYYKQQNLLAYEEIVREISPKIRAMGNSIPMENVRNQYALLLVWPLVETYNIMRKAVLSDIRRDERLKLLQLENKYTNFKDSSDMEHLMQNIPASYEVEFLNPYELPKNAFVKRALCMACNEVENHIKNTHQSHVKIVHDAQMGASMYIRGKDPEKHQDIRFMQRLFTCVSASKEPVLFIDCVESGTEYFKSLNHWRGYDEKEEEIVRANKLHDLYIALAAASSTAQILGINKIVPRDYELTELSRQLGMPERKVFDKKDEYWKAGLHCKKKHTAIYTHSLLRGRSQNRAGHQLRHTVLEVFPYSSAEQIYSAFIGLAEEIIESNKTRVRKAAANSIEKLNAASALNHIINEHILMPSAYKENSNSILKECKEVLYNISEVRDKSRYIHQ